MNKLENMISKYNGSLPSMLIDDISMKELLIISDKLREASIALMEIEKLYCSGIERKLRKEEGKL